MFIKHNVLQGTFSNLMTLVDRTYFPPRSLEDLAEILLSLTIYLAEPKDTGNTSVNTKRRKSEPVIFK